MPGSTATSDVERLIEQRLREIEEQLKPFTELEQERTRLQKALGALRDGTQRTRSHSRAGRRAPRGSNLTAIVDYVSSNPGATAGQIAGATGISRGVVYSATSRLASAGKLSRAPKPDGQVGYAVPARS